MMATPASSATTITAATAVSEMRRGAGFLHQREQPEDAVQRRADLVAHVREELATYPGQILRGDQRLFTGLGRSTLYADIDEADHRADDLFGIGGGDTIAEASQDQP